VTAARVFREASTLAALVVALVVVGLLQRRNGTLRDAVLEARLSSRRGLVQDRLTGRTIDLAALGIARPGAASDQRRPMVLWVVDLDSCSGCFDGVGAWSRLERLGSYDLFLILLGARTADVEARIRALRGTNVTDSRRAQVVRVLGPVLPSTRLLLDADGVAILVDSRASGQECGWSFEAQVASVTGVNSGRTIRRDARQ
jgi:hypothetical protein